MDRSTQLRASHTQLSQVDWQFRELAQHDPELLSRATFQEIDQPNIGIMGQIQPWPTFVHRERIRELAEAGVAVSQLIQSLPERVFQNDPQRIAEYYRFRNPEHIAQLAPPPNGMPGLMSRADFVYHESRFQCLECNMAANLGGWNIGIIAGALRRVPVIQRFLSRLDRTVSITDTAQALLGNILDDVRAVEPDTDEIHVAIGASGKLDTSRGPTIRRFLDQVFAGVLRAADPDLKGSIVFTDYSDLSLRESALYSNGKRVHALIEFHDGPSRELSYKAFRAGKLRLYNGPIKFALCNKRTLALLSEMSESELFDEKERAVIRNHVPWTRRVTAEESTYEGETVLLRDFLIAEHGRMVMKLAYSSAGRGVVIGKTTAKEEWSEAVDRAIAHGAWVVQEFVESLPYLYQEGDHGCSPFDLIWGPFVFGKTYGGTIARMRPKHMEGTVDISQGFQKGIVLEVDG
ncbi:MAG: hypothetical protein GY856_04615 [bacterium]|nr:hypothetical protein [bacterium]